MSDEHDAAPAWPDQTLATERLLATERPMAAATGRLAGALVRQRVGPVDAGAASREVERRR